MKNAPLIILLSLVLSVAGSVLVTFSVVHGWASESKIAGPPRQSLKDHVLQAGVIRCGYVLAAPSMTRDPNTGRLGGYSYEILEAAAKRLGLKLDWTEELQWGTMMEGLPARYEMIGSVSWRNSTRARAAAFSVPVLYSGVGVYARSDDHRFDTGPQAIDSPDIRVSVLDGELSQVIARERFPNARMVSLPQMSDVSQELTEVLTSKADVSFMENNLAAGFLKANPNRLKNVVADAPLEVFPECFILPQGDVEFKGMLDAALAELLDLGEIDRIVAKYEASPGSKYRVARPYSAAH